MSERHLRRAAALAALSLAAAPPAQEPPTALVGATVYDGSDSDPIRDAAILIEGRRVSAVGARADVEIPAGTRTVDLSGRFVTPGLVDTHVHYSQTGWADGRPDAFDARATHPYEQTIADCEAHPERFHLAFLHSGVTAVFDVGAIPGPADSGRTRRSRRAPRTSRRPAPCSRRGCPTC